MGPTLDFDWAPREGDRDVAVSAEFVEGFSASMPPRYRVLFGPRSIRAHAAVAQRRGARPAHGEVWRDLPDGSAGLCIVAEDRPGLLSAIAAALVMHRLDVLNALVFSRMRLDGGIEAVDLVWVRRANAADTEPIDADEAVSIGEVLSAILSGSISVEEIASHTVSQLTEGEARIVVRFAEVDEDGMASLVVEAPDRPGMLLTIAHELFQHGAQIVRSLVRTAEGRAFNRFDLTEFNGGPLSSERREQICSAVFAALALGGQPAPV
jgi:[protein-PII] uridylyltransferase